MRSSAPSPDADASRFDTADPRSATSRRLVLCDDHEVVRQALSQVLGGAAGGFEVVAEVADPRQLSRMLRDTRADLLLLDLHTGPEGVAGGLQVLRALTLMHPRVGVVVLSAFADPAVVQAALAAGCRGFVGKGSGLAVLVDALRAAGDGQRYVDPTLVTDVCVRAPTAAGGWDAELSPREREVLRALCAGERLSSLALRLGVSVKTVGTHKMRLMRKLDVRTTADLIRLAHDHGLSV